MEEKELSGEQPVVEKVSMKDIAQEKTKAETGEDSASKLVEALKALDSDGIMQVMAYVDKKIDILDKLK